MHPIRRYCEEKGITQKAFAEKVGLSEGFVSQLISGRERCGREAAIQIFEKCEDEIGLEELLTWEPSPARERRSA